MGRRRAECPGQPVCPSSRPASTERKVNPDGLTEPPRYYLQVQVQHVLMSRCRDPGVLQDREDKEEVTGSLLGGDADSSPEEEDGDEEDSCPPRLAVPRPSQRPQSTLHCITLNVQQVGVSHSVPLTTLLSFTLRVSDCLQGQLLGVCGCVGSGKTSLISAILGQVTFPVCPSVPSRQLVGTGVDWLVCWQLTVLEGSVAVRGRMAYVAQQAWILNATLRDNILFGQEYEEDR